MYDREYSATIQGTLSWDLVLSYDNTSNSSSIRDKRTVATTASINYVAFKKNFDQAVRKQLGGLYADLPAGDSSSYKAIALTKVDMPDTKMGVAPEVFETLQQTTSPTFNSDYSKMTTYEREVTIGPMSTLQLYQGRFTSPGICILGLVVSTGPPPPPQTITISYLVRPIRFISDIKIQYGSQPSDAPSIRVLEHSCKSDDVSGGYGLSKCVWLVPIYTYDTSKAATRFDLFIQSQAHYGWDDVAKGSHSDWTYLRAVEDANNHSKITELKLYRSKHPVEIFPPQYTDHTDDINNGGRGGTFLYLMWSTETAL